MRATKTELTRRGALGVVAGAGVAAALGRPARAQWRPSRPVTIIVPWAAGGATDQIVRLMAAELEPGLGQRVVVVNQPGAAGSIGTRNAVQAEKDGYTWISGAAKTLGVYELTHGLATRVDQFNLFLGVALVSIVGVNPGTPYQSFDQLLAAFRARPGQVPVATAGNASSGHLAMEGIAQAAQIRYRHVTYDGGAPAVVATVSGEAEVTTQLSVEQSEMIHAKRLRPLATVANQALELEGVGSIPAITQWVPNMPPALTHFGFFIPKGVPQEVVDGVTKAFEAHIPNSQAIRTYARQRGALVTSLHGDAAYREVWPNVVSDAWLLHAAGATRASPDTIGIPRPSN
ncbi:MAG: tripartite tricarboxylate transporter substrate binding protein [Proteobacteria bacterium]|nr:tripartite tricarboxylate transporter substrate binding protein [Pseudomonadota bacterium]